MYVEIINITTLEKQRILKKRLKFFCSIKIPFSGNPIVS